MARLDATLVWFQRGEDAQAMAEMPSTDDDKPRVPQMVWIVGAVALTAATFCGTVLHMAHAGKIETPPALVIGSAASTRPAAAPPTQAVAPAPASLPALQIARPAEAPKSATPAPKIEPVAKPVAAPSATSHVTARTAAQTVAAEKLLRHGRAAAALPRFQQVLARDNDDVRALRGACLSLAKLGRMNDAARVCRRALDRAPDDLETRRALATIYYNGGAYKWSAAEWRQVVAKAPRDGRARKALRAAEARSDRG